MQINNQPAEYWHMLSI